MRAIPIPCLLLLLAAPAAATPVVKDAALTLYSQDLGLVRQTREVRVGAGAGALRLGDLAARLDVSSVRITPRGAWSVRGWSYRDAARGWQEAARGQKVRVLEVGDREVEGTLVAADQGSVVLQRSDTPTLLVIAQSQVKEIEVPGAAEDVRMEPALEVRTEGKGGRSEAELSYLTGGLSWQAEHVVVRDGEKSVEWSAAAALANHCGADFKDARVQLVAGEPHRTRERPVPQPMMMQARAAMETAEGEPRQEAFADYHLYTLDGTHDLRDAETRSVTLLGTRAVRVTPRYFYNGQQQGGVRAQLQLENRKDDGLGVPLAAGRVRFYQRDASGGLLFTGEDRIRHTAVDEKLTLEVGVAFDLAGERKILSDRRVSDREREQTVELRLRNRKPQPVTIVVSESVGGDFEVIRKTHEFVRKDANTIEFTVPVPAGQETRVEYAVRIRW